MRRKVIEADDLKDDRFSSQCDLSEIPARGRCLYNTRNPHLPCTIHPYKVTLLRWMLPCYPQYSSQIDYPFPIQA
jgi:hypothetical protein